MSELYGLAYGIGFVLENGTVTLRDRDSMEQMQVPISFLREILSEKLKQ